MDEEKMKTTTDSGNAEQPQSERPAESLPKDFYKAPAGKSEFSYLFEEGDDADPYDFVSQRVQQQRETSSSPEMEELSSGAPLPDLSGFEPDFFQPESEKETPASNKVPMGARLTALLHKLPFFGSKNKSGLKPLTDYEPEEYEELSSESTASPDSAQMTEAEEPVEASEPGMESSVEPEEEYEELLSESTASPESAQMTKAEEPVESSETGMESSVEPEEEYEEFSSESAASPDSAQMTKAEEPGEASEPGMESSVEPEEEYEELSSKSAASPDSAQMTEAEEPVESSETGMESPVEPEEYEDLLSESTASPDSAQMTEAEEPGEASEPGMESPVEPEEEYEELSSKSAASPDSAQMTEAEEPVESSETGMESPVEPEEEYEELSSESPASPDSAQMTEAEEPDMTPEAAEDEADKPEEKIELHVKMDPKAYRRRMNPIRIEANTPAYAPVRAVYEKTVRPLRKKQKRQVFRQRVHRSAAVLKETAAESIAARRARRTGPSLKERMRHLVSMMTPGALLNRARNIEAHPVQSAAFRRSQLLQAIFTGVCCVLLTALSVCGTLQLSFTEHLAAQTAPHVYALIHVVLLTGAILVCRHTVLGGIRALLCRSDYTGADGMIGMMMMACLAQSAVSLFHGEALQQGRFVLYGAVGLFILCMNSIGRLVLHNRIRQLEKMMDEAETVETARLLREESRLQKLIDEHIPDRLTVYVQPECEREVVLANAAEPDGSQRLVARLTVPLLLAALIVAVVALVFSGSGEAAWSAFTASLCVCAPATAAFCMNIPMGRLCKRLAKYGASVASWSGVSAYGETGCAVIHDAELFSGESMALKGIKTIREERLEVAIPAAAAVLRSAGGPMRSLFDRMVREAELELPQAEQVQTEDGGVIGWVRGRRVLVGSGKMLEAHGVKAPSRDYEAKNCPEDMHFVYLAFGGELVAMFILEYTSDDEMYEALVALAHAGCDLTVLTADTNVTETLIRECFGLPAEMLQLIPRSALEGPPEPEAESNAQVILTGGGRSLLRALAMCVRSKPMMELASALQLTGMVLGLILLAVFAATGAIHRIGIGVVFLFDLFWMAAVTAVPSLKKL